MGQRLHSEKYWSIEIFTTNKVIHSILCCKCKWQLAKKSRMPMKFKWAKLLVFACYFKRARLETNDHCSTTWPQLIHTHNHVVKAKVRVSVFAGHATLSRACLLVGHIQYIPTAAARHALSSFYAGLAAEHQQRAYYVLPRTRLILRDVCVCSCLLWLWFTGTQGQNIKTLCKIRKWM